MTAGANGQFIEFDSAQANGVKASGGPGAGWNKLVVKTPSAASNVTFDASIDSTYDAYVIHIVNLQISAQGQIRLEVSQDGGSTWETASNDYFWDAFKYDLGNASPAETGHGSGPGADSRIEITADQNMNTGADDGISGFIHLHNPSTSGARKNIWWDVTFGNSGIGNIYQVRGRAAHVGTDATDPIDAVRLVPSTGTVTGRAVLFGIQR